MARIRTIGAQKTKKLVSLFSRELKQKKRTHALVFALEGNLGAGKTTFTQGFAKALGVAERVLSPTFVLIKIYAIRKKQYALKHLIHIDCYRIDSPRDLVRLGFKEFVRDRDAVILIEWADRIRKLLPRDAVRIKFSHGKRSEERIIEVFGAGPAYRL